MAPLRCASCKSPYWNRPRQRAAPQGQGGSQAARDEDEDREWYEPVEPANGGEEDEDPEWFAPVEQGRPASARALELVEIPSELGMRHEPMIKGKGTPVWVLVAFYTEGQKTPEEISQLWKGYITPAEVRAALAYWRKYSERVDSKLNGAD